MTAKNLAIAVFTAALVVACAGTPFKWDSARQIQPGMTIDEVTRLVGTPNNVRAEDDTVRYVWVYVNSFEGTRTLVVDFRNGKVIKAPPIPDSFK